MTDLLNRDHAPLGPRAFDAIEDELATIRKHRLTARRLVDFTEPAGAGLSAIDTHRIDEAPDQQLPGIKWGLRRVLPLLEVRAPFSLPQQELEFLERGAKDANLEAVSRAAEALAHFEETLVYRGIPGAQLQGLAAMAAHEPKEVTAEGASLTEAVVDGVARLSRAGIAGPYDLVLEPRLHTVALTPADDGRPLRDYLAEVSRGDVHTSIGVAGGLLLSRRGGDFELVVGQDAAVGYESHDAETVHLFAIETLLFRVLEPKAVVRFDLTS